MMTGRQEVDWDGEDKIGRLLLDRRGMAETMWLTGLDEALRERSPGRMVSRLVTNGSNTRVLNVCPIMHVSLCKL